MERNVEVGLLFEIYGSTLTDKQRRIVDDYYNNDLSLSEISENINITRQAVRDNLKNAEKKLYDLESKLHMLENQISYDKVIKKAVIDLSKMEIEFIDNKKINSIETLTSVKKMLNKLIKQ